MPLYIVQHSLPLTPTQKSSLAQSITRIHATKFTTPSLFVNVRFDPLTIDSADPRVFVAGKPHPQSANQVHAIVRQGPSRTKADFDEVAAKIIEAWDEVVARPSAKTNGHSSSTTSTEWSGDLDKKLYIVSFVPFLGVTEAGLPIAGTGEEASWLREKWGEFERRARDGQAEYVDLIEECRTREDLRSLLKR